MHIKDILAKQSFSHDDMTAILSARKPGDLHLIQQTAEKTLLTHCGNNIYFRGLIEFSNRCSRDCHYCGIRKSNTAVHRYELSLEQTLEAARWCSEQGYGSIVLQTGERTNPAFIETIIQVVKLIKQQTQNEILPEGLGITLCVGEQTEDTYQRFFEAGVHRYLLRIETTNPDLFARIHPPEQSYDTRLACLTTLRKLGFQVGTGVMIGIPGQTLDDLAADVAFFIKHDIDMVGMGPYIPHEATPLGNIPCLSVQSRMRLSLLMIAMTRLALPDINIASTTALQALDPTGREQGLQYGANIIMPQLTPTEVRQDYLLYPGKPCLDESSVECRSCLEARIYAAGRSIGYNQWGDSPHARKRLDKK